MGILVIILFLIRHRYCVGNLIGPQLFFEREEPHYRSGFIAMIICLALDFILLVILHRLYVLKNKKVN